MYEVKPEAGTGGNRTLHRNLLLPSNNLPINIPNETGQKRERRFRKDKRSTASQIPKPQAEDLADGTCRHLDLRARLSKALRSPSDSLC